MQVPWDIVIQFISQLFQAAEKWMEKEKEDK